MIENNLETLRIHTLTQEQYSQALADGKINSNEIYLTPDEDGFNVESSGEFSHAEGYETIAEGDFSHAGGKSTIAMGEASTAHGINAQTYNQGSSAFGSNTIAGGKVFKIISGNPTPSEGLYTITLDSVDGISEALIALEQDEFLYVSIKADTNFDYIAKIAYVDEKTNTIKIDGYVDETHYEYVAGGTLWVTGHPELGTTVPLYPAHSEGCNTIAQNIMSHAEGYGTQATGRYSHAEGYDTRAGYAGHAEGHNTLAKGNSAHAEGGSTEAIGHMSHAEGCRTKAVEMNSHAEGYQTTANGGASHSEGNNTTTDGVNSHAEGKQTLAHGDNSHAEGNNTSAHGDNSHAEGQNTTTYGTSAHAEGQNTTTYGTSAHAEGFETVARGDYSHAEGLNTNANGDYSHAGGNGSQSLSQGSFAHGNFVTTNVQYQAAFGKYNDNNENALFIVGNGTSATTTSNAFEVLNNGDVNIKGNLTVEDGKVLTPLELIWDKVEGDNKPFITSGEGQYSIQGYSTTASGDYSHSEGYSTTAIGNSSHAEGNLTITEGENAHAEGYKSTASGGRSHAEGVETVASGTNSHAEGSKSKAIGQQAHAEGYNTTAEGHNSHAEGSLTKASGQRSHAEGYNVTAGGDNSHAGGEYSNAGKLGSFAHGNRAVANADYQTVFGTYNTTDANATFIIGNGSSNSDKSNAFEVSKSGDAHIQGKLYVGGTGTNKTSAKEVATIEQVEDMIANLEVNPDHTHTEYMSSTNPVGSGSFSMNRMADSTIGNYSHTEGMSNIASGYASHAEGQNTNASGYASHAEGFDARTSGDYSHAEGEHTNASGYASHAEGGALFETDGNATWIKAYTEAEGDYSHAEGEGTKASGEASHAEGYGTTASGEASHAEGCNTTASGNISHAEGNNTTAGHGCHTEGYGTTAISNQHVQGHWNNTSNMVMAGVSGTSGTAFVIGNGTNNSRSNAFRVDYSGEVYAASSSINTGADYAEFFEWQDANPNVEDRRGYFVTLDGEQIRIAQPNDYILGIVSGQPAVIGNGDEDWRGRYILDEFGAFIIEEFQYEEKVFDKETGETNTVIKTGTKYKENPEYDPSLPYVQRKDRPEWDAVGMIGVLSVRDDGTCKVNGFCKVAEGGIATTSENGYRVIKRVSDNIIKVIFK